MPGVYFNIKYIGKLPGPTNEFERSLVFETGEFDRPKFDCNTYNNYHVCPGGNKYFLLNLFAFTSFGLSKCIWASNDTENVLDVCLLREICNSI